jgi:hypothetical protein
MYVMPFFFPLPVSTSSTAASPQLQVAFPLLSFLFLFLFTFSFSLTLFFITFFGVHTSFPLFCFPRANPDFLLSTAHRKLPLQHLQTLLGRGGLQEVSQFCLPNLYVRSKALLLLIGYTTRKNQNKQKRSEPHRNIQRTTDLRSGIRDSLLSAK